MERPSFYLRTYGCKTNQYEAQGLREELLAAGWREAADVADAGVILVNTCVVTGRAAERCRDDLLSLRAQNPQARLIVTGCAADTGEGWLQQFPFERIFRNREKGRIAAYLRDGEDSLSRDAFAFSLRRFAGHTRAFLKIQDGCDNYCSYCIIPQARGEPCSRPVEAVLREARELVEGGHRELVLTGINIGRYLSGTVDLAALVEKLAGLPGLLRLRLGSLEPQELTARLLGVMAESPAICPHLHLPLQSGDDRVLRAMNRRYTTAEYLRGLEQVRARLDVPALTTDLIVGFPGEDAAAQAQTVRTLRTAGFSGVHLFTFSPRAGTPAAGMTPCLQREVRERRAELSALTATMAAEYAQSLVGREEAVIVQRRADGVWTGHCGRYLRTAVAGAEGSRRGDLVRVRVSGSLGADLRADIAF